MHILVAGGTGMIGKALAEKLVNASHTVCILSRQPEKHTATEKISYAHWNPALQEIDAAAMSQADYVVNLTGEGIANKRWSKHFKQIIRNSRVESTKFLCSAIQQYGAKVKGLVSASGIGWYGNDKPGTIFTENDAAGNDFMAETCRLWEKATESLQLPVAHIRTGPVFDPHYGMIPEMMRPIRRGIAPIFGSGKQVVSWIHTDDIVRIYTRAIEENWRGTFNAVAPTPVTQRFLVTTLAAEKRGALFIPVKVPSFVLRMVAGGITTELVKSTTVSCEKIKDRGFQFIYPTLQSCLHTLVV